MTGNKFHDQFIAFLRDTYGATDLEIRPGGKHHKLAFLYNGKRFSVTVSDGADPNALQSAQRGIVKVLGPAPDLNIRRVPRTLEAMTAAIPTPTPPKQEPQPMTYTGTLTVYASNKSIVFQIPNAAVEAFFAGSAHRGVKVEPLWGPQPAFTLRHTASFTPRVRVTKEGFGTLSCGGIATYTRFGSFATTKAEYTLTDDTLVVRTVEPLRKSVPTLTATAVGSPPVDVTTQAKTQAPGVASSATMMRSALDLIRAVERDTDYQLVKLKTDDGQPARWVFRAPVIE